MEFHQQFKRSSSILCIYPWCSGVSLDYVRFAGTAYEYKNADLSITTIVQTITDAVKAVDPNVVVSIAIMPEPNGNIRYYGQNFAELSRIVDYIIPMEYKGNYHQSAKLD